MKNLLKLFHYSVSLQLSCLLLPVRTDSVFNSGCTPAKMINGIPMHSDRSSQVI